MGNYCKNEKLQTINVLSTRTDEYGEWKGKPLTLEEAQVGLQSCREGLEKVFSLKAEHTAEGLKKQVLKFCADQKIDPSVIDGLNIKDKTLEDKDFLPVYFVSLGRTLMCAKLSQYSSIEVAPNIVSKPGFPSVETLEKEQTELEQKLGLTECKSFEELKTAALRFMTQSAENAKTLAEKLRKNEKELSIFGLKGIEDCALTFSTLSADTHGNIPPTKISVQRGDSDPVELVCKSRKGLVDCAVTNTFKLINDQGGLDGKGTMLPAYEQIVLDDGSLVSTFVEGFRPDKNVNFMEHPRNTLGKLEDLLGNGTKTLEAFGHPEIDLSKLVKSGKALAIFALSVGLNDLHMENVICTPDGLVPIDLESFNFGKPGGCLLYKTKTEDIEGEEKELLKKLLEEIPISEKAKEAMEDFRKKLDTLPRRLVPVRTEKLKSLVTEGKVEEVLGLLRTKFLEADFTMNDEAARAYIESCTEERVVPMFTVQGNFLYHGVEVDPRYVVAKRG